MCINQRESFFLLRLFSFLLLFSFVSLSLLQAEEDVFLNSILFFCRQEIFAIQAKKVASLRTQMTCSPTRIGASSSKGQQRNSNIEVFPLQEGEEEEEEEENKE